MSDADRARWDARHAAVGPGVPQPPDALRGRADLLAGRRTALDVACGRGDVAVWLALRGLRVTAVDVSPVALAAGRRLAAAHGVTVDFVEADLDVGLPVGPKDAPALPSGGGAERRGEAGAARPGEQGTALPNGGAAPLGEAGAARGCGGDAGRDARADGLRADAGGRAGFDLVVCQRFRDPALYPALARALAPGGLLAITVLSEIGDRGGDFRAAPGELRTAFAGLDVLADVEGEGVATLLARHP